MTEETNRASEQGTRRTPLWRRIVDFPLVAMVLAVAALMLTLGAVSLAPRYTVMADLPEATAQAIGGLITAVIALLVYKLLIVRMGEKPRDDVPFDHRFRDAGRGALVGLLLMSAIVAVAALLGAYRITGWGGSTSWPFLLLVAGFQAAVFEEILMRGIIFRFLEEFGGSWFALVLSAVLFGFGHAANPNATLLSSIAIAFEAGIMLGGAYMLTRNLWLAIGIHFGWNVTQGYVWDVPVSGNPTDGLVAAHPAGNVLISGGAFGLEASLIALVLATGYGIWLVVRAVRRGEVMRPWWVRRRLARQDNGAA